MSYVTNLKCRECGQEYPISPLHVCETCFGPLEVGYDYAKIRAAVSRAAIERRPHNLWRYRELLPVEGEPQIGPCSGFTPLVRAERLGAELGIKKLYIKDDTVNHPTLSYKDRVVSVAISKAREFGFTTVSCASTGNLATAVAAHAARAGLNCVIFMPEGVEMGKIVGSTIYGARVITIRGNYDDVNRLCSEIADKYGWAFVNINLRPYYTEGAKTFGYEVAEQLGWRVPDHIVVPTAGGTILPKIAKGFKELREVGLLRDGEFKIHCAQAAGAAPVIHALHKGTDLITPVKPDTIAKSIAIGNPADGYYVLRAVRESGGWGDMATDPEIIDAIKLLAATEGIFTEPAGGTTLAVTIKLIEQKRIKADETVVVAITGNGYKTVEAVAQSIEQPYVIEARLKEFDALFARLDGTRRALAGAA
ncbi:MAG TPA: threonine synthase [Candidatus Binataceae bacterium]|nr:threonine synthase [Stellaceae bacterium]HVC45092.1 threonine synthase [Candidatus Binataceae bacterium]